MLFADLALARRLEGCDSRGNAQCVREYARLYFDVGAAVLPIAGGNAMYAGADSPLTQAIGLGMSGPVTSAELNQMEGFYRDRGTAVQVEVCPLADPTLSALFAERRYRIQEYSNVLARQVGSVEPERLAQSEVEVRVPAPDEAERWALTVAEGFAEDVAVRSSLLPLFLTYFHLPATTCYLATCGGQPAGGGVVATDQGVATLFSACTRPAFRNRGVQTALLRARLALAAETGCDVAMIVTQPGSTSQRNAERQGFRVIYTRSKMALEWSSGQIAASRPVCNSQRGKRR